MRVSNNINDNDNYTNHLIYGKTGVGKTVLSSSLAEIGNLLYIAIEEKNISTIPDNYKDNITIIFLDGFRDLKGVFDFLQSHQKLRDNKDIEKLKKLQENFLGIGGKPIIFKSVVIDSLTELQQMSMQYFTGKDSFADIFGNKMPKIKEWGQNIDSIVKSVEYFNKLSYHICYTCGIERDVIEATEEIKLQPLFDGKKTVSKIDIKMQNIYYYKRKRKEGKTTRAIITDGNDNYIAKNKLNLNLVIKSPTFKKILKEGGKL